MAQWIRGKKFLRLSSEANRHLTRAFSAPNVKPKGLVLGAYYNEDSQEVKLTPTAEKFNQICQGKLLENIKLTGNKIAAGKNFIFWGLDKQFSSVAVVGLGNPTCAIDELELISQDRESVRKAASAGCRALNASGVETIFLEDFGDAEAAAEGGLLGTWKFQDFKTKKDKLPDLCLWENATGKDCWDHGIIKADAQNIARRLADTPANLLTPTIFAEQAQQILSPFKNISVKVYDESWAKKQKMGALLCVAKGSVEPLRFLEISYENSDAKEPLVLVGKGVTFDAGGISLKPAASMDEMRADMSGAASVVGALHGVASLKTEANIKVLIPLVENLPSGTAVKPGDVVTARNGKTICVDNTDAEGRLILADALAYSETLNPKWVLDIATLTGAIRVALGDACTGVFTNDNVLYSSLENAGSNTGDRVWKLPLWNCYTKFLTKNNAFDLNNIGKGGKGGGSCTAAAFLRQFVPEKTPWLHLDIAGVMGPSDSIPYLGKGMTGRPTRTLIEFIQAQSKC